MQSSTEQHPRQGFQVVWNLELLEIIGADTQAASVEMSGPWVDSKGSAGVGMGSVIVCF